MYRGTLNELSGKLSVNGRVLGYQELYALTRVGEGIFCTQVGTLKTSAGKGKPAKVWEFKTNPRFRIEAATVQATGAAVTADGATTAADVANDAADGDNGDASQDSAPSSEEVAATAAEADETAIA